MTERTERDLRLCANIGRTLRACVKWDPRTYWDPLIRRCGIEIPPKCAISGLIGHFGRVLPFFFWVNRFSGWEEADLWQRIDFGLNGDRREFFSSGEILEALRQMLMTRNGIVGQRVKNFANKILEDHRDPQQRINWVTDKPSSLD